MSDQGKDQWITKREAKDVIRKHVIWHKAIKAIDALEPVAEVQDAVSREAVRVMLFEAGGRVYGPKTDYDVLHRELKKLPPVLPVEAEAKEPGPDYKAMINDLEKQVTESKKAMIRSPLNIRLEKLLLGLRAKHTPQAESKTEEKPEGKDE